MKLVKRFRGCVYNLLKTVSPAFLRWISPYVAKSCADNWRYRTKVARACPDNAYIPRVSNAGQIIDGWQIMHNGLKVQLGSYYGPASSRLVKKNRGVHEPQEERMFQEVLKVIPPGSVIIELGAYWAFYSMWFCQVVHGARAYMVEPVEENLVMGQRNFAANSLQGRFTRAYVGRSPGTAPDGTPAIAVDAFVGEQRLEHIAILHSDIQGFELEMLQGAENTIKAGKIWFFFISTHSAELHQACERFLREHGCSILASVAPAESYSIDGVLVCASPRAPKIAPVQISKRPITD